MISAEVASAKCARGQNDMLQFSWSSTRRVRFFIRMMFNPSVLPDAKIRLWSGLTGPVRAGEYIPLQVKFRNSSSYFGAFPFHPAEN